MFELWHRLLTLSSVKCVTISPFWNCEFRVDRARYVSSFCKQVFRLPICTGKTMVSTLHMGLISCRDWFCELLLCKLMYVLRMTRHSVWQTFSVVYLYPLCGSKIQDFYWLIKGGQLSNVVFDPYPFEAYVCLQNCCVFDILALFFRLNWGVGRYLIWCVQSFCIAAV